MPTFSSKLVTIERHILEQQRYAPEASGRLTQLLYDIAMAAKIINREVRRAGLADILGADDGPANASGDEVKKLDTYADRAIYRVMDHTGRLACMASEEQEDFIPIPEPFRAGEYVLLYDPLDGSSNIDACATIGTIFSIQRKISTGDRGTREDCLQPGHRQVAAGYVLYGSSCMMVYTTGHGVHGFTLDPTIGEFLLSHENLRVKPKGSIVSVNERDLHDWDENLQRYIDWTKCPDAATNRPRTGRYIGSMVADFHRTLVYGGLFLYPGTKKRPEGKLRMLYEVNPLAMVMEQAGGKAIDGSGRRVLDLNPTDLHERTSFFTGSPQDVDEVAAFLNGTHPDCRAG